MERDFIVRTHRDGTMDTNADIEATVTKMGCTVLTERLEGSVTAVVEKEKGQITKSRLRWDDESAAFKKWLEPDANVLLQQVTDQVKGNGGDNGELRVKVRGKM